MFSGFAPHFACTFRHLEDRPFQVPWYWRILEMTEASLAVKLSTIRTDEKQKLEEAGKTRQEEKSTKGESQDRRSRCAKMFCGSGRSKTRLPKAAGAEPSGQRRDEKLHAAVARSTLPSQNVQNSPFSDHFWKLRCWKSALLWPRARFQVKSVLKKHGRIARQAQGTVHFVKGEQYVRIL